MPLTECPCGSGLYPFDLFDARGIYVTKVCDRCEDEKKSHYRPEIFTDGNYKVDEDIEPEEPVGSEGYW